LLDGEENEREEQDDVDAALQAHRSSSQDGEDTIPDRAAKSTIWTDPRPSISGPFSQTDATAMAGSSVRLLAMDDP
jgi:hypothetical protein